MGRTAMSTTARQVSQMVCTCSIALTNLPQRRTNTYCMYVFFRYPGGDSGCCPAHDRLPPVGTRSGQRRGIHALQRRGRSAHARSGASNHIQNMSCTKLQVKYQVDMPNYVVSTTRRPFVSFVNGNETEDYRTDWNDAAEGNFCQIALIYNSPYVLTSMRNLQANERRIMMQPVYKLLNKRIDKYHPQRKSPDSECGFLSF